MEVNNMNLKTSKLLAAALGAGVLGFCLRLILYRTGFDDRHILSSSHPLHLACLGLTALLGICLLFALRSQEKPTNPAADFPPSLLRAVAALAAGGFMAYYGITLTGNTGDPLDLIHKLLAFVSGGCMLLCALVPLRFRRGQLLFRGLICLFFVADMLCRYRGWSGNPQLPDYVFQVPACVLLASASYQRLAFDADLGNRRWLLFSCLMGAFLCMLCTAGPESRCFYLGGAFWAGSCVCSAAQQTQPEHMPEAAP
jgi:hypothetical protein